MDDDRDPDAEPADEHSEPLPLWAALMFIAGGILLVASYMGDPEGYRAGRTFVGGVLILVVGLALALHGRVRGW